MAVCGDCGGTVIEYDAAAGNGFCVQCGTVVEENTIVSEVTFGETGTGAAMVQGSYIGQTSTHARMSGPFGTRGNSDSREQTISNASKKIRNVASVLRLSEVVSLAAIRMYTLAVEHKFTKGRKNMNVIAVCLYVACRQKETRNYMLIDFSDLVQVNVFELGHTYLQLVQTLNLKLPLVDPSHYISRFAALLEFGEETPKVAQDAVRLVQRFDRDWMTKGRRPAGICGACLLLAARMNNFRRSVQEIVQVVKIADTTLKKRLDEFKKTPSGALTLADFRNIWLEEEMDPPAYTKGKERDEKEKERERELERERVLLENTSDEDEEPARVKKRQRKRRRKRKRGEDGETDSAGDGEEENGTIQHNPPPDPTDILNQGILEGVTTPPSTQDGQQQQQPLFLPETTEEPSQSPTIDPTLINSPAPTTVTPTLPTTTTKQPTAKKIGPGASLTDLPTITPIEETANTFIETEVTDFLSSTQGASLAIALEEAEAKKRAIRMRNSNSNGSGNGWGEYQQYQDQMGLGGGGQRNVTFADQNQEGAEGNGEGEIQEDDLGDLDDDELDQFLLNEDEVRIKERIWVEINRDYLEAIAARGDPNERDEKNRGRKRRKPNKPRDASTAHGSTAAESVRNFITKNPKYSKRINYDALKSLFTDSDSLGAGGGGRAVPNMDGVIEVQFDDDKDDDEDGMYRFEDADEDAEVVTVEEGGGVGLGQVGVGVKTSQSQRNTPGVRASSSATGAQPNLTGTGTGEGDEDLDADAEGEDDVELDPDLSMGMGLGMNRYREADDYGWDDYEQEV